MEAFLRGLLWDLERRCAALAARLRDLDGDPDVRDHALGAYRVVDGIRRAVAQLLTDPSLGTPALLPNHLHDYRRWNERATLIESYPLPFVERYAEPDRRITRLCRRLAAQVRWPLPPPLVGAFSSEYYWTRVDFDLVCVPAGEEVTLLGLPDLCHELAHLLLFHRETLFVGDFLQELAVYIAAEQ